MISGIGKRTEKSNCISKAIFYMGKFLKIIFLPRIAIFLHINMAVQTAKTQHRIWWHIVYNWEPQYIIPYSKSQLWIKSIRGQRKAEQCWTESLLFVFIYLFIRSVSFKRESTIKIAVLVELHYKSNWDTDIVIEVEHFQGIGIDRSWGQKKSQSHSVTQQSPEQL